MSSEVLRWAVHDMAEFGGEPTLIPFEELQFFEATREEILEHLSSRPPHYTQEPGTVEHVVFVSLVD